jgi:alpha-tubulin suppressor-like RCC1 family protein
MKTGGTSKAPRWWLSLAAWLCLALPACAQTFNTNSFAPAVSVPVGGTAMAVAIADVDGDGWPDLVAGLGSGGVGVLRNRGNRDGINTNTFEPPVLFAVGSGNSAYDVAVGDLDGDGKPELVVAVPKGVVTLRNQSAPGVLDRNSFGPPVAFLDPAPPLYELVEWVELGDLDGDGRLDAAYYSPQTYQFAVRRNVAEPGALTVNSLAPPQSYAFQAGASTVLVDVDGDGRLDVLTGDGRTPVLLNLSQPGAITLQAITNQSPPQWIGGWIPGDLNGDGKPDLAFPGSVDLLGLEPITTSVRVNLSSPGTVSFSNSIAIYSACYPYLEAIEDLDGDGRPDLIFVDLPLNQPLGATNTLIAIVRNESVGGLLEPSAFVQRADCVVPGSPPVLWPRTPSSFQVEAADIDGDGKPDLIVRCKGLVSVLRNQIVPVPEVRLWGPVRPRRFSVGENVPLRVQAFFVPGAVTRVEFYDGGTLLGTASQGQMATEVQLPAAGLRLLTARVFNDEGQVFDSPPVMVLVVGALAGPLRPVKLAVRPTASAVYAIHTNGMLYAWGDNYDGQLGNGRTLPRGASLQIYPTEVKLPEGVTSWQEVSAGGGHALAISQDGRLFAWGYNRYGQLGTGNYADSLLPAPVVKPTTVTAWKAIAAGGFHNLALGVAGRLFAWGANGDGQLGLGHTNGASRPRLVNPPPGVTGWESIAAGGGHSLALGSDGNLYAWGWNRTGQVGNGTTNDQTRPVLIPMPAGVTSWLAIAAGNAHSLALGSDGHLYAWGINGYGTLGLGGDASGQPPWLTTPQQVFRPTNLLGWKSVSAGFQHNLAIGSDDQLYAWGDNTYGELGIGRAGWLDWTNVPTPVICPVGVAGWRQVSAGTGAYSSSAYVASVAVDLEGLAYVWPNWTATPFQPAPICSLDNNCPGLTNLPPWVALTAPTNGTTFTAATNITVAADTFDPDGFVERVELFAVSTTAVTNRLAILSVPPFITNLANAPAAVGSLFAIATDNAGATTTSALLPVRLPTTSMSWSPLYSNALTGLIELPAQYQNRSTFTLNGLRVVVTNLPPGVQVVNQTGETNGLPYIQYCFPIPPNEVMKFTIELNTAAGTTTFEPRPLVQFVFSEPPPAPVGELISIAAWQRAANSSFLLQFDTVQDRNYWVQFSDDLLNWKTSPQPVAGNGGPARWLDNGPPRTDRWPRNQPQRFYRVVEAR